MTVDTTAPKRARAAGARAVDGATREANHVSVPMAWRLGLGDFVRQTVAQVRRHSLNVYAGNFAFRGLFAVFPSLIALFWLLKAAHADALIRALHDLVGTAMPEPAAKPIQQQLAAVPGDQANGAFTVGALLALVVALWAISGMFRAAMEAMSAVYGVEDRRSAVKRAVVSLGLGLAVAALLVGALFLVVFGSALAQRGADATGLGPLFRVTWGLLTWPVLTLFVLAACALIYYFAPDVEQRARWISMGAVLATALWLLFTVVYSIYINNVADYEEIYGALAGIALLMAYVYGSSFILLLGAEMNQVIETSHPGGKSEGERAPGPGS